MITKRLAVLLSCLIMPLAVFAKDLPTATFETSLGTIICELYADQTPMTVTNFIELAEGKKQWVEPNSKKKVRKRFYDGLIFHRVIPDFMIQTGCPLGTGYGGPGYRFKDEIVPGLTFDRPGLLAMANSGPNTNGSQIFITEVPTPWLNGRHTIFGRVIDGMDVVKKIARVKRSPRDKPVTDVTITRVTISHPEVATSKSKKLIDKMATKKKALPKKMPRKKY